MTTDADKYGATADHDAVPTETAGVRMADEVRDSLAKTLEGPLAALGGSTDLSPDLEDAGDDNPVDEDIKTDEPEADTEPVDDEDVDVENEDVEPDDSDSADDKGAADDGVKSKPTLPEAYRRSLKAYQWTDDEIDEAIENNPEQFTATALRIHRTRNDEISKFAEAGRKARQGPDATPAQPEPESDPGLSGLSVIDKEALIEKYGNEEIVDAIVSPVNDAIGRINKIMPELQAGVVTVRQTQQETLGKMIDDFFENDRMAPYAELYGTSATRTSEQLGKHQEVLELADAILAGAGQQGRQLSFEEAMDAAHSDISRDFQGKAARTEIKTKVKKRGNSLTLKPSHGGKTRKSSDKPRTRKELETKVGTALAKVFA